MKRRINPDQFRDTSAYQAALDHKAATLNVLLAQIPEKSTFAQLAELVGFSREWVRQKLIGAPERLSCEGQLLRRQQMCMGTTGGKNHHQNGEARDGLK